MIDDDKPQLETYLAIILGKPGTQGSKKMVKTAKGFVMIEASQRADEKFTGSGKSWRQELITEMGNNRPDEPLNEAVVIKLIIYVPRPQAHFRANGMLKPTAAHFPGGKPDLDKVMRAVGDAAVIAKWIKDDSRIAEWRGNPGRGPQRLYLDDPSELQRTIVAMWSLEQEWMLGLAPGGPSKQEKPLDLFALVGYDDADQEGRARDHD